MLCPYNTVAADRPMRGSGFGRGPEAKDMAGVFFGLLVGLELKHYVADYGAQPA